MRSACGRASPAWRSAPVPSWAARWSSTPAGTGSSWSTCPWAWRVWSWGWLLVPAGRATAPRRLDPPGLVLSAAGLAALVVGLVEGQRLGWTSPAVTGSLAAAALLLAAFAALERRVAEPMLPPVLARRGFLGASLAGLLVSVGMLGAFFLLSLYMQQVLGYSPLQTGAAFLPLNVLIMIGAPLSGRLSDRGGPRRPLVPGLVLVAAGLLTLRLADADSGYLDVLPGLVLLGAAMGLTTTPVTAAAMEAAPRELAGVAAGALQSSRQLGATLGVALLGAAMSTRVDADTRAGRASADAVVDGFHLALAVGAGAVLAGAVAAAALVPRRPGAPDEARARPRRAPARSASRPRPREANAVTAAAPLQRPRVRPVAGSAATPAR